MVGIGLLIIAAALMGADPPPERGRHEADDPSGLGVGQQITTADPAACELDSAALSSADLPIELADGATTIATLRVFTPTDRARPLLVVLAPSGHDPVVFLSGTRLEDPAVQSAAAMILLQPVTDNWQPSEAGEATQDLMALREAIDSASARLCLDPTNVTLISYGDATEFAASVSCAVPDLAPRLALVGASKYNPSCPPDPGRGVLVLADRTTASFTNISDGYAALASAAGCTQTLEYPAESAALTLSTGCLDGAQVWLATIAGPVVWNSSIDDLLVEFLDETGATGIA